MKDYRTKHDYSEHGQRVECEQCDERFRRSRNGDETICRWCLRSARNERPAHETGATVSELRDLRERPWRLTERVAVVPSAPAQAEPVHAPDCLCGQTSKCNPF